MKKKIVAMTLICLAFLSSTAVGMTFIKILTVRGVSIPMGNNTSHCAPNVGICDLLGGDPIPNPDKSLPYDQAGFDEDGNLVIEFVNYDFDTDDWLKGNDLKLEGDFVMSDKTARYLGGDPVTIKAGRYHLEYLAAENKKVVVFK